MTKEELYNSRFISIEVVNFFIEDIDYSIDFSVEQIERWLQHIAELHQAQIDSLNFILCSDEYLLDINQKYLVHDFYTDVITFDNSDNSQSLEGDIFISLDRIKENALSYNVPFHHELFRVFVHGLLHLLGFEDQSSTSLSVMRQNEDLFLNLYFHNFQS